MGSLFLLLLLHKISHFTSSSAHYHEHFGLSYNGGKIMTEPISVSLLWFGTGWNDTNQAAITNAISSLSSKPYQIQESDVPTLANWWEIVRQYDDKSNVVVTNDISVGAECYYRGPEIGITVERVSEIVHSAFNETEIKRLNGSLSCKKPFALSNTSIYHVLFSHTVKFTFARGHVDLSQWCRGNFVAKFSNELSLDVLWARAPFHVGDQCSLYLHGTSFLGAPNGDEKIDSLVGNMLANIADEATNKDGKGWISNDGNQYSVSGSCASVLRDDPAGPPVFSDQKMKLSFNAIGLNGHRYVLPYIWNQKISNCALKLSDSCSTKTFYQPKGQIKSGTIVNHTDALQPYPPNQYCQWKVRYHGAKFISFALSMVAANGDHIKICKLGAHTEHCQNVKLKSENVGKSFNVEGSQAIVKFSTNNQVSFGSRGWELNYSVGHCDGVEDIYDRQGIIGYTLSDGYSYAKGMKCQWVLHGKPGTPVTLSFTQINITKDLDFVAVYNGSMWEVANFSGPYSGSALPKMNLTGKVTIAFATQTDKGEGWSANFHIASPVDPNRNNLLVAIGITSGMAIFFMVLLAFLLMRRKRRGITKLEDDLLLKAGINWDDSPIGEGTSAIVFRAVSTDGTLMAVKSPKHVPSQLKLEEEILFRALSHPNIITLKGYGEDKIRGRCLIFEYMNKGSLRKNLQENGAEIDWEKRLNIAIQVTTAIHTLHSYMMPPVCHGNITSENVLMDEEYNAKLGGFGAANYCRSFYSSLEMPLEMANDIYTLGLLLVELLRGETAVIRHDYGSSEISGEINQLIFGQDCLDPRLTIPEDDRKVRGLAKLGEIAKWCLSQNFGVEREETTPKIGDVLSALKQSPDVPSLKGASIKRGSLWLEQFHPPELYIVD